MKLFTTALLLSFLSACTVPHFVGDTSPVAVTTTTPSYFELPARFALARTVYGRLQAAGTKEAELWDALTSRTKGFGSFTPLIAPQSQNWGVNGYKLAQTAREQRYNYVLWVRMHPETGTADISLLHTGSGGMMATARAVSADGGKRGFWGGRITNPARLDRATLKIAKSGSAGCRRHVTWRCRPSATCERTIGKVRHCPFCEDV